MLAIVGRVAKTSSLILMFALGVVLLAGAVQTNGQFIRAARSIGGTGSHGY